MKEWQLNNQTIYEIGPLAEYLAALSVSARCQDADWRLLLIGGEAGVGKSVGARVFMQESRQSIIHIALPSAEMLGPRHLLDLLGAPVGLYFDLHCPRYEMARQLVANSHQNPRVFILDDAQCLIKGGLLDMVRWLHDEGAHTFIMVGSPALERVFRDRREFGGRVALRHHLRLPTADEIAPVFAGFSPEAIAQIHQETGGRMRQVMAMRKWLFGLIAQRNLVAADLAPKQVEMVARHFLVKVA